MTAQTTGYYERNSDIYYINRGRSKQACERRAAHRIKKTVFAAALSAVILTAGIFIGNSLSTGSAQASPVYSETLQYTSVRVTAGDTLWSIADEYMPESYADRDSYIEEVKRINNLTEDTIHAGAYLVIPYSSY